VLSTKSLLTIAAAGVLSIGAGACGSSSKNTGSVARVSNTGTSTESQNPGGTDDDIPAYGHEAPAGEKQTITALVKRYYAAAGAGDGKTACSLLYTPLAKSVPEDYGKPPGPTYSRGKTCAVVMSKTFRHLPGPRADITATEVTDVRIYHDHGFAELRSKTMPKGEIFIERQNGSWKIGATVGRERAGP
jgi:hypothetical protein